MALRGDGVEPKSNQNNLKPKKNININQLKTSVYHSLAIKIREESTLGIITYQIVWVPMHILAPFFRGLEASAGEMGCGECLLAKFQR